MWIGDGLSPGSNGTYKVTASVVNTGKVAGAEVVQVYVGLPSSSGEPPKRLVGFHPESSAESRRDADRHDQR